jgi:hypothetical protein
VSESEGGKGQETANSTATGTEARVAGGNRGGAGLSGDSRSAIRAIECVSLLLAGSLDQGLALLASESSKNFATVAADHMWLQTMDVWSNAAFLLRALGIDHPSLRSAGLNLAKMLTPYASLFAASHIGISAPVAGAIGCSAYSAGARDEAIEWFENATELCAKSGFTYCGAYAQAQMAIVLLDSYTATSAEREMAQHLIQDAGAWADSHGAVKVNRLVALGKERLMKFRL